MVKSRSQSRRSFNTRKGRGRHKKRCVPLFTAIQGSETHGEALYENTLPIVKREKGGGKKGEKQRAVKDKRM